MNNGEVTVLVFALLAAVAMVYVIYQTRVQRLEERERAVREAFNTQIFESYRPLDDGHIFKGLWRLSHITRRAQALGYPLTMEDCFYIIGNLKKHFDPDTGISNAVIDRAIRTHIGGKVTADIDLGDDFFPGHRG
jgi:type II secretory pathway pseudopilin PulG